MRLGDYRIIYWVYDALNFQLLYRFEASDLMGLTDNLIYGITLIRVLQKKGHTED